MFNPNYLYIALGIFIFVNVCVYFYLQIKQNFLLKELVFKQETYEKYPNLFNEENWKCCGHSTSLMFIPTDQPYHVFFGDLSGEDNNKMTLLTHDRVGLWLTNDEQQLLCEFIVKLSSVLREQNNLVVKEQLEKAYKNV